VTFAPEEQVGGLTTYGPGSGGHTARMRPAGEIALCHGRFGVPGSREAAVANLSPDLVVRVPERSAPADQLLRHVCGDQSDIPRGGLEALAVELEMLDQKRRRLQAVEHVVDRREERRLVFLQIAVVSERKPLEGRGQRDEAAHRPARTSPKKLGHIRIPLLRHQARPRGDLVRKLDEAKLGRGPQNDVFAKPAQMDRSNCAGIGEVKREVSVGDGIDAVLGQSIETKLAREDVSLEGQRRCGQRSRTERHLIGRVVRVPKSCRVAAQGLGVGEQVMAQRHRLGSLQMGVSGHDPAGVRFCLVRERVHEVGQADGGFHRGIPTEKAQVERDLVVARSPRVQRRARRRDLDEAPFDRGVDVLVLELEIELVAVELALDLSQATFYRRDLPGREDARRGQAARVREAACDVVRIQLEVDRERR